MERLAATAAVRTVTKDAYRLIGNLLAMSESPSARHMSALNTRVE